MSGNSGKCFYAQFMTFIVIFLGFMGEVFKHQTKQIRYTSDQLYKIGKTFYITKLKYTTENTIKSLDIKQTFRTKRTDRRRRGKRGGKNMLDHGIQIREYTEAYLYHLKDTTKHHGALQ